MEFGVSWYPEHKDTQARAHDIRLMEEAGITLVRMGEFAWCLMEPQAGEFHFQWLDDAVAQLGKAGIRSVICTPTACPPPWMTQQHPEIAYVDNRGMVRPNGGRRHYCYTHPVYREYCRRIADQLGQHYGKNPHVLGFQIDNELAQEGTGRCHCPVCTRAFREWLREEYGTVEVLNHRMGTLFWGHTYDDFSQIDLPVNTTEPDTQEAVQVYYDNPSLHLAYERFCSSENTAFQNVQADALRQHTDKVVTTNGTGLATNSINYYQSFGSLDRYAFDYYPSLRGMDIDSFPYAFGRGVRNMPFWVLEFVSGGGHKLRGEGRLQGLPGAQKQSVMQAFAAGAELLAHFQFRTFPMGAEQLNYAILDADGVPRRRYEEMKETAAELKLLAPYLSEAVFRCQAAVVFDYDSLWAHRIKPAHRAAFNYVTECGRAYATLTRMGFDTDVISAGDDFTRYRVLVVPAQVVMPEATAEKLKAFVKAGGTLLSGYLTAVRNGDSLGYTTGLPGAMTDLFGVVVGEVEPVFPETVSEILLDGHRGCNRCWTEVLELHGAETAGIYSDTFRSGQTVISRNTFGNGTAWYVGTALDQELEEVLYGRVCREAGLEPDRVIAGAHMEIFRRVWRGKMLRVVFNFHPEVASVVLYQPGKDLISGEWLPAGAVSVAGKGYRFILEA